MQVRGMLYGCAASMRGASALLPASRGRDGCSWDRITSLNTIIFKQTAVLILLSERASAHN